MRLDPSKRLITPGRAVFSAIGLRPVYGMGAGPLNITKEKIQEAAKLEPRLHDAVYEFLDGKRDADPLPPCDLEETKELLFRELLPEERERNLAPFQGGAAGDDFAKVATDARLYLQSKVPRRLQQLQQIGTAKKNAVPSKAELLTFRRHLATVEKPLWAVRQLLAAMLTREHIQALRSVWPDVLATVQAAAESGVGDKLEKDPAYLTPRRIARQLAVLLEKPSMPSDFVAMLQNTFVGEQQAAQEREEASTKPDDRLETTVQRVADQR